MYTPSTDIRAFSPWRVDRQGGLEGWYRRWGVGLTRCDDSIASTGQALTAVGRMLALLGLLPCWTASGPSSLQWMALPFLCSRRHTPSVYTHVFSTQTHPFSARRSWDISQAPLCFATYTVNSYLGIYSSYHPCPQPLRRPLDFLLPSFHRLFLLPRTIEHSCYNSVGFLRGRYSPSLFRFDLYPLITVGSTRICQSYIASPSALVPRATPEHRSELSAPRQSRRPIDQTARLLRRLCPHLSPRDPLDCRGYRLNRDDCLEHCHPSSACIIHQGINTTNLSLRPLHNHTFSRSRH